MSLNSVNIMGNLTRDPELRSTPAGKFVCNLSIANNRTYTSNGQKNTEVSFDVAFEPEFANSTTKAWKAKYLIPINKIRVCNVKICHVCFNLEPYLDSNGNLVFHKSEVYINLS